MAHPFAFVRTSQVCQSDKPADCLPFQEYEAVI
jgi:hypothetical protein